MGRLTQYVLRIKYLPAVHTEKILRANVFFFALNRKISKGKPKLPFSTKQRELQKKAHPLLSKLNLTYKIARAVTYLLNH
jgi:hypothetical protein